MLGGGRRVSDGALFTTQGSLVVLSLRLTRPGLKRKKPFPELSFLLPLAASLLSPSFM